MRAHPRLPGQVSVSRSAYFSQRSPGPGARGATGARSCLAARGGWADGGERNQKPRSKLSPALYFRFPLPISYALPLLPPRWVTYPPSRPTSPRPFTSDLCAQLPSQALQRLQCARNLRRVRAVPSLALQRLQCALTVPRARALPNLALQCARGAPGARAVPSLALDRHMRARSAPKARTGPGRWRCRERGGSIITMARGATGAGYRKKRRRKRIIMGGQERRRTTTTTTTTATATNGERR